MEQELQELCTFLQLDSRLDVKSSALNYILGLTAIDEGRGLILQNDSVLQNLLDLTTDSNHVISRDALLAVLNSTACDKIAMKLISMNVIPQFLSMLVDPNYGHTNSLCMVLSNITRQEEGAKILSDLLISDNHPVSLSQLVDKFDKAVPGRRDDSVDYLATVFLNITQVLSARQAFLRKSPCLISHLLAYTQYQGSLIRRGGIIGLLRNLCFEVGWNICTHTQIFNCFVFWDQLFGMSITFITLYIINGILTFIIPYIIIGAITFIIAYFTNGFVIPYIINSVITIITL